MHSDVGPVDDLRAAVVARLRARRGELVEAIFARVSDVTFGVVGAADAEYRAGLREAVGAAVEHGLDGIERGEGDRSPPAPIPPAVSGQARRAARMGVPLETVLRRYVVGHTLMGEFVLEEAERGERDGIPTQRGALRDALRAQASVLDRLLETITGEYEDELARAGRPAERRPLELVRSLLAGERGGDGGGGEPAGELAGELGYELGGEHVGAIALGGGARELLVDLARGLDRRLLCVQAGEGAVWAWLGGRRRMEIATLEPALAGVRCGDVSFAIGEPARGIEGWRLTHRQAQAALVVALRRPRRVTRYADVALLAMALKDEGLTRALVEIYIEPLDDERGGGEMLRETLRAYFAAERNNSSAAAALKVTRKTVENRLRTIEERIGRSLHRCPAELEVALELDDLGVPDTPRS